MNIEKQQPLRRGAGILLPVASLPSPYGIGTLGRAAYEFVEFLERAGQRYWQVLPLGPTSYGDSPYQSFSACSGNPYLIDLETLAEQGLLTKEEIEARNWGSDPADIDYALLYQNRFDLLHLAFARSSHAHTTQYQDFCAEHAAWLGEYSEYMAIKTHFGGQEWLAWPEDIRMRQPHALEEYTALLREEIDFWKFCQYQFALQWHALKEYASGKGIQIIGDIPIYVALDSADVWAHPQLFQLDERRRPTRVAGVPPDLFSTTGQLWGNPLYDWERMRQEDFAWWKRRMQFSAQLYDVVRIDHFVGVAHYYAIPAGDDTAKNGVWNPGPGVALLAAINEAMGGKRVIAENLGEVTPEVDALLEQSGYPGMKLMQFGFDGGSYNPNLPSYFQKNEVIYGGTHDNETLVGFFRHQEPWVLQFARDYLNAGSDEEIPAAIVRAGYASVADTVIFQLQDLMGLDNHARINTPSTIGQNWRWRLLPGQLPQELAQQLRHLVQIYGR